MKENTIMNKELDNLLLMTDSYKVNHWNQYPENTQNVYSYFESRLGAEYKETVFFGLQYLIKKHLIGKVVTKEKIDDAEWYYTWHFGDPALFNRKGWEYILEKHDGVLPIVIRAVEEGTPVTVGNALMTVEVLDELCDFLIPWVTNFLETMLTHVWFPSTVATRSREIKKVMKIALDKTCDAPELSLPFMLHDFGFRGTSSLESAGIGGLAHLVNFVGTDTVPALWTGINYYGANLKTLGFSVPASEHSVATAKGEQFEEEYLNRMIDEYPNGVVSIVADSYDITRFVNVYVRNAKEKILNRWKNGTAPLNRVVIRPDSPRFKEDTPHAQVAWLLETLWDIFGGTINSKGYRVLHPCVGVIYGDGLSIEEIGQIYRYVTNHFNFNENGKGFDCSSVVVGQGGGLLQKLNRDTQRFAFKCSAQKRDGIWYDVQKNPLDKTKASKAGRLALIKEDGEFKTIREEELNGRKNLLEIVFENGELIKDISFELIRNNSKI